MSPRQWLDARALGLAMLLLAPAAARAHALGAECRLDKGTVRVEAYFEDNTPAQQALVRVLDAGEREVAQGKTDAKGRWSFPAPAPGVYRVIVDAGGGHREVQKLTIPGSAAATGPVGSGPSRAQFTGFPWIKVALALGTIALVAVAFVISRQFAGRTATPPGER